ncbi:MAG: hypothetical protein NW224_17925 [Leptolyngbyaceae cyanobacterium bins.302]|nr:hypothetical protein [Leptolyngbyaceae cyanobacterium bins.302]
MRSPSPSNPPVSFPTSQQFLIPPFDRLRFTVAFTLVTGFGWFLIWLVLQSSVQDPLMPAMAIQRGLTSALVTGLVAGLVVSAMQWLVLRRYLMSWLWIVAGATGYVMLTVTLEVVWGSIGLLTNTPQVIDLFEQLSPTIVVFAAGGLRVLLATVCALWLGFSQWMFLRHYTRSSLWWLAIPSVAVLLASSFGVLSILLLWAGVWLPLEIHVLAAGILGSTQAIGLCSLQKRTVNLTVQDHDSPLLLAPEILDYNLVQTLAQRLHRRLNMAWTTEHLNDDSLTYLVGVTQTGAIAAYAPVNLPAVEQLHEIPLPELTLTDRVQHQNKTEPLARFEVTFLPSGSLQVQAWCGVPLGRVALSMATATLSSSVITACSIGLVT